MADSNPCSKEHIGTPRGDSQGRKGSDQPIVELDKDNPSLWKGQTPGPVDQRGHLTIERSDVKNRFEDDETEGEE